ncbi:hypothetical protein GWP85_17060 [Acinetobacter beijerinckii]|uniref:hypothetical protein n=1 Tax=Acinetobacter beijerinckii TaxID=262668 RepID=UPI0023DDE0A8|nr:hypothetical protein [Acinetobacter beijerinckii]MDF2419203.1 hypothetical protein [Acinetobacter beijerinckii]
MDRKEVWKKHEADVAKADRVKDRASKKGFKDKVWKAAVSSHIDSIPLCEDCSRRGYVSVACAVVHKTEPKLDRVLFWDKNNWLSVCSPCHQRLIADMSLVILEPIHMNTDLYLVED